MLLIYLLFLLLVTGQFFFLSLPQCTPCPQISNNCLDSDIVLGQYIDSLNSKIEDDYLNKVTTTLKVNTSTKRAEK